MRRSTLISLIAMSSLLVLSGCRKQTAEDPRISDLEAENAALRAQLLRARQPKPEPRVAARPALDAARRRKLENAGVKVRESGDTLTLTLPNKVLFASGSASLRSSARRALNQSAAVIKSDLASAEVVVEGHTDNQPIRRSKRLWKTNYQLSVARAKSVAAYLRKAGVNPANISVKGLGSTKALATNKTSKGRALNRRVEIVIQITP
jgi:chemotaxis protein MotB